MARRARQCPRHKALQDAAGRDSAQAVLWDPDCAPLVEEAAAALAAALAALVDALDPEALVIGGGLGLEPAYRTRWEPAMRARLYSRATATLPILDAELGADAGIVGAAVAAAG